MTQPSRFLALDPRFPAAHSLLSAPADTAPQRHSLPKLADPQRWHSIEQHTIGARDAPLDFVTRLAREQGWTLAFAQAAQREYLRFCYLCVVYGPAQTPSYLIDQVWHLHLTYTQDYWQRFCTQALGMQLHHQPTEGNAADAARYREQYAQTLKHYAQEFGDPPAALWPSLHVQFANAPALRMYNSKQFDLVPKRYRPSSSHLARGVLTALGLSLLPRLAHTQSLNPLSWGADAFLTFFVLLIGASIVASKMIGRVRNRQARPAQVELDAIAVAYLQGGEARALHAAEINLIERGVLGLQGARIVMRAPAPSALAGVEQLVYEAILPEPTRAKKGSHQASLARRRAAFDTLKRRLVSAGLIVADADRFKSKWPLLVAPICVLIFGVLRWVLGVLHDRPVGYLTLLCVLLAGGILLAYGKAPRISPVGIQTLNALRQRNGRLQRAPTRSEFSMAFALFGYGALVGTDLSAFAEQRLQNASGDGGNYSSSSSSSSSGDGGSSSDGDSGGSGCGGCGGGGGD